MTGHMVLSTLHTNDAISTAMRLLDMGVDNYLVASSLRAVMAQRLVKRLCDHCQESYQPDEQEKSWLISMAEDSLQVSYKRGRGCHHCNNTGYSGRIGIYELLEMDTAMITAMRENSAEDFAQSAKAHPRFRPLALCALDYARQGITSLDEVFRVSASLGEGG
jgi:MSHA biogenesis protein MshE